MDEETLVFYSLTDNDRFLEAIFRVDGKSHVLQTEYIKCGESRETGDANILEHLYNVSENIYIAIPGTFFIGCRLNRYIARERWEELKELGFKEV